MDLQELAERIQRWKTKKEKGGRDVEEIIQEEPVDLQTSKAPDSLWQQHETTEDITGTLEGTLQSAEEYTPESLDDAAEVVEGVDEAESSDAVAEPEAPAASDEEVAQAEEETDVEKQGQVIEAVDVQSEVESEDDDSPIDSTTEIAIESMEEVE